MQIADRTVVQFHYTLKDAAGAILESSRDAEPTAYLHGVGGILPALERELAGKQVGDSLAVTLAPADAFGERRPNSQQRISAKYLRHEGKLKPGQAVSLNTDDGVISATVVKVGKFSVDVDLNHPLAGQTVTFEIDIVNVRAATEEELAHGHAHGEGGHHH